jgi:hypothetical protein
MSQPSPLEIQVIGASLDEIREVLGISGSVSAGSEVALPQGATLKVGEVSKSSGFDVTTVILTAVITIATSASSELLIEWLKSRLFKGSEKPSAVTILIDGKEIQVRAGS